MTAIVLDVSSAQRAGYRVAWQRTIGGVAVVLVGVLSLRAIDWIVLPDGTGWVRGGIG